MTQRVVIFAAALTAFLFAGCAHGASRQTLDTSMLRQWTPGSRAEMRAQIPYALAHLAVAWTIAGDKKRAGRLLDELARRGDTAYGVGYAWAPFPRITETPNPADTPYTVNVAIMAEAYRQAGRTKDLAKAVKLIRSMPLTSGGGCVAYDAPNADAGCVHDANAYILALYSRLHIPYAHLLAFEQRTMLPEGTWLFWEEAPETGMYSKSIEDPGHLSGMAYEYLTSPDPKIRALGHAAAVWLEKNYTGPDEAPFWAYPTVLQAEIADGYKPACDLVSTLLAWADAHPSAASIAALTFVWAQGRC